MDDRSVTPNPPVVVKKQTKSLFRMYYGGYRFKVGHVGAYANEMVFALNLAAEARLVVTAQHSGSELSLWVEGMPDELGMFFKHMDEVRQQKARKAEAIKQARAEARRLVKQAEAADYSKNPTSTPIVVKPRLVKSTGERVM